jgi:serine/threonine protein kinase
MTLAVAEQFITDRVSEVYLNDQLPHRTEAPESADIVRCVPKLTARVDILSADPFYSVLLVVLGDLLGKTIPACPASALKQEDSTRHPTSVASVDELKALAVSVAKVSFCCFPACIIAFHTTIRYQTTHLPLELPSSAVRLLRELSSGLSSVVYCGVLCESDETVLVKRSKASIRPALGAPSATSPPNYARDSILPDAVAKRTEFIREVSIMSKLPRHDNVCRFYGYCDDPNGEMFMCYEYADRGSLNALLSDRSRPISVLKIARDIANGMAFLHRHGILHRDLKSGNIVLASSASKRSGKMDGLVQPDDFESCIAKVSDFGLSCDISQPRNMTAETGTYRWMAPEVIRHENYSYPADVYSFGILLWELVSREQPYAGLTPIQAAFGVAKHNLRPVMPNNIHPRYNALVNRCWYPSAADRPTFDEIVQLLNDVPSPYISAV